MSVIFADSFDHYNTAQILRKWSAEVHSGTTTPATVGAYGRYGTNGLRLPAGSTGTQIDSTIRKHIASTLGLLVGFAWQTVDLNAGYRVLVEFREAAGSQLTIRQYSDGTLRAYRGATLLGTSTAGFGNSIYRYLEVKAFFDNSTGSVEIRVNNVVVLALTNVDTQNQVTSGVTSVAIGGDGTSFTPGTINGDLYIDDVVFIDTQDAITPITYLGDVALKAIFPNGAGNYTEWTPSAGSNFQNVDETPADDDATYNYTQTVNARDTYAMQDIAPATGTVIKGVMLNVMARKDDAGTKEIAGMVRHGGADATSVPKPVNSTYEDHQFFVRVNPSTSNEFTIAEINAMEAGVKLTT